MVKKRFGIDQATNEALSQTMQMAKGNDSNFNNTVVPIAKIILDSENPRKHKIKQSELVNGPSNRDPQYQRKSEEYNGLIELSSSIKKEGLLHPIIVYKDADQYKLVAGERRFFASIIAGKTQIEARVFKSKPRKFDLKIIQWAENESRKDLSLYNRLINVAAILEAYQQTHDQKLTAQSLAKLLSISRQLAQYYVAILANSNLMKVIKSGKIKTLRLARQLTSYQSEREIIKAITLSDQSTQAPIKIKKNSSTTIVKRSGRKRQKVTLGDTTNPQVAKILIENVLSNSKYKKYVLDFENIDWNSLDQVTRAFQKLVNILEAEAGGTR